MKKSAGCFLIVVTFACIGPSAGYSVGHSQSRGGTVRWESDPLPDGQRPIVLHAGPMTDVYAESDQGRFYVQTCTLTPEKWRRASELVTGGSNSPLCGRRSDLTELRIPAPPGPVKARLDCQIHLEYTAASCSYVILENGELWRWRFDGPGLRDFTILGNTAKFGAASGLLGLLLYGVLALVRERPV